MQLEDDRFHLFWTPLLKRDKGRLMQAVGVVCPRSQGQGGQLNLRLGGRQYKAAPDDLLTWPTSGKGAKLATVYLWLVPRPTKAVSCTVTWKTQWGKTYRDQLTFTPARPVDVYVASSPVPTISAGAAPATLDAICGHVFARQQSAGGEPRTAILSDASQLNAAYAMALASAGVEALLIPTDKDQCWPKLPRTFWWKLPDTRRVLCHLYDSEGAPLLPPADYAYRHWLSVQAESKAVYRQVDWIGQHFERPACRTATVDAFVEAMLRDHGRRLPAFQGELTASSPTAAIGQPRACEQATAEAIARTTRPMLPKPAGKSGKTAILLFNAASWTRGGLVRMSDAGLPAGEFELVDPTTGGLVLYQRDRGPKGTPGMLEFIAPPVPACGYLHLEVRPVTQRNLPGPQADWNEKHLSLHFEHYVLQFHAKGGMCRWHDRARSMQWCSTEVDYPTGTYLFERPGQSKKGLIGGGPARVTPLVGPLRSQVVVEADAGGGGSVQRYRSTFTLYRGQRDLRVRIELLGRRRTAGSETGYGFFPLYGSDPFILVERMAQLVEPSQDFLPGVNTAQLAVHRGVRVECEHAGVNFYPLDTPLIGFGAPGASRFDDRHGYEDGVMYATLFDEGVQQRRSESTNAAYEFLLRPTGNDEWDGGLSRYGLEVFRPIIGTVVRGLQGPQAHSLLRIEPDLVQLAAMQPASSGSGVLLRLWSADPDPLTAKLTLPCARPNDVLEICDLFERPIGKRIRIDRQGRAQLPMKPHEIVTLRLHPPYAKRGRA